MNLFVLPPPNLKLQNECERKEKKFDHFFFSGLENSREFVKNVLPQPAPLRPGEELGSSFPFFFFSSLINSDSPK